MPDPVHIAITRRIRPECVGEFERELAEFASRSLADPHSRGVQMIYPAPGSGSTEYGILRSFASEADRAAFYASEFYSQWSAKVAHMMLGTPQFRELSGLEAWFREAHEPMPPKWKMALLTWVAVWPISLAVGTLAHALLGNHIHFILRGGIVAAGIVCTLTWAAMPLLVKLAHHWLHPNVKSAKRP